MAYESLSELEISSGKAVKKELWRKIRNNFNFFNDKIFALEGAATKVIIWNDIVLNAASANTITGLDVKTALFPFKIIGCEIQVFEVGSLTGFLEVDIKRSVTNLAPGSFSTIFTTKPRVNMSSGNYAKSTNQAYNNAQLAINTGDHLRFDVTNMPGNGVLSKFILRLYGEPS